MPDATGSTGVLFALFSTGGAAFIWVLFKGVQLFRTGTSASEGRAIKRLEKYTDDADKRADRALMEADYWRRRAGVLEFIVSRRLGDDAVPELPPKPWEARSSEVTKRE